MCQMLNVPPVDPVNNNMPKVSSMLQGLTNWGQPVCCGLPSVAEEKRVMVVEPILCCDIEKGKHNFCFNFTQSES